jgi:hypothetical protein
MKALNPVSPKKIGYYNDCKKDYSKNYNYINTTQTGTRYQNMSKSQPKQEQDTKICQNLNPNNNKKSNESY